MKLSPLPFNYIVVCIYAPSSHHSREGPHSLSPAFLALGVVFSFTYAAKKLQIAHVHQHLKFIFVANWLKFVSLVFHFQLRMSLEKGNKIQLNSLETKMIYRFPLKSGL